MSLSRHIHPGWGPLDDLDGWLNDWCARAGAHRSVAGKSVEGRPIPMVEVGPTDAPTVLLTGLVHGIELVGALALLRLLERWVAQPCPRLRLVALPVVNPDAFALNHRRIGQGQRASRRSNLRGVDLNRNFARLGRRSRHPFAGSTRPGRPYYIGPQAFSEPETRAVAEVATRVRPQLSLGFHSFGELLVYPWAHRADPHPRTPEYLHLAEAFTAAQGKDPYAIRTAHAFYPTVGDLDDWLDHELGTLAYTVEVSRPCARLLHPGRALNPFFWMNPLDPEGAIAPAVEGSLGLLDAFAGAPAAARRPVQTPPPGATALAAR